MAKQNKKIKTEHNNKPIEKKKKRFYHDFILFDGCIHRLKYMIYIILINLVVSSVNVSNLTATNITIFLVSLYVLVLITLKRCRDFGYDGTLAILITSLAYPINNYFQYLRAAYGQEMPYKEYFSNGCLKTIFAIILIVNIAYMFALLLTPGIKDEEKDCSLTSPLFKNRCLYMGFFFVLYLIGYYAFTHRYL